MAENSLHTPPVRVGPSRLRCLWRAMAAWFGDHPLTALMLGLLAAAAVWFCGVRLHGFAHLNESFGRWRMEAFGGTFQVKRAIELPDVFLSFREENYDRLDAMTASAAFMGGTAFRDELKVLAERPGARLRVVALDPRMGEPSHPHFADFTASAEAFGMDAREYRVRSWHSLAVLLRLLKAHAPALEVRLLDRRLPETSPPFLTEGRSLHLYRHGRESTRLDVLVPHPSQPDGTDSFSHPGFLIRNRPDNSEVKRFAASFESAWQASLPLDAALQEQLLQALSPIHESSPPGNQP
jgi:hypothetical protein